MQYEYCDTDVNEGFTTLTGYGAVYQQRFSLIAGLSALSFLVLGGAEILVLLFGHNYSAADLPFQLQSIVIAGLSFGLCILAVSLVVRIDR
jgi:hypothetical protein